MGKLISFISLCKYNISKYCLYEILYLHRWCSDTLGFCIDLRSIFGQFWMLNLQSMYVYCIFNLFSILMCLARNVQNCHRKGKKWRLKRTHLATAEPKLAVRWNSSLEVKRLSAVHWAQQSGPLRLGGVQ